MPWFASFWGVIKAAFFQSLWTCLPSWFLNCFPEKTLDSIHFFILLKLILEEVVESKWRLKKTIEISHHNIAIVQTNEHFKKNRWWGEKLFTFFDDLDIKRKNSHSLLLKLIKVCWVSLSFVLSYSCYNTNTCLIVIPFNVWPLKSVKLHKSSGGIKPYSQQLCHGTIIW